MFGAIKVSGFRGIDGLRLEDLKRLNLIVGKNGAGKTSLLEAVFLLAGAHPELGMRVNTWRGIPLSADSTAALFGPLFARFPVEVRAIGISADLGKRRTRRLSLRLKARPTSVLALDEATAAANGAPDAKRVASSDEINWEISEGTDSASFGAHVVRTLKGNEIESRVQFEAVEPQDWLIPAVMMHMGVLAGGREDIDRVERLIQLGQLPAVLDALRPIEGDVRDIRTLGEGGERTIWVEIGDRPLMPVGLLGGGFQHLLSMALAGTQARSGVVLLDEVDTGLHYSVLGDVLSHLVALTKAYGCQIYATTHSWDCLAALGGLGPDFAKDVAVYRIDKTDSGAEAVRYDYDMLQEAVRSRLEVR